MHTKCTHTRGHAHTSTSARHTYACMHSRKCFARLDTNTDESTHTRTRLQNKLARDKCARAHPQNVPSDKILWYDSMLCNNVEGRVPSIINSQVLRTHSMVSRHLHVPTVLMRRSGHSYSHKWFTQSIVDPDSWRGVGYNAPRTLFGHDLDFKSSWEPN